MHNARCPNTERANCDVAGSSIVLPFCFFVIVGGGGAARECLQVCAPMRAGVYVTVLVAAQQDAGSVGSVKGEREEVGGCCCYGNSQAGLSIISLPLCLLELWEETREEGCPETATAFKRTVTTLSDKSL